MESRLALPHRVFPYGKLHNCTFGVYSGLHVDCSLEKGRGSLKNLRRSDQPWFPFSSSELDYILTELVSALRVLFFPKLLARGDKAPWIEVDALCDSGRPRLIRFADPCHVDIIQVKCTRGLWYNVDLEVPRFIISRSSFPFIFNPDIYLIPLQELPPTNNPNPHQRGHQPLHIRSQFC